MNRITCAARFFLAALLMVALAVLPLPRQGMAHGGPVQPAGSVHHHALAGAAPVIAAALHAHRHADHHGAMAGHFSPPSASHPDKDRPCCAQDCCLTGCLAPAFILAEAVPLPARVFMANMASADGLRDGIDPPVATPPPRRA
ncbi:MAG: hypothetical protein ACRCXM_07950 [Beijerinckiaceae bacterium]